MSENMVASSDEKTESIVVSKIESARHHLGTVDLRNC